MIPFNELAALVCRCRRCNAIVRRLELREFFIKPRGQRPRVVNGCVLCEKEYQDTKAKRP